MAYIMTDKSRYQMTEDERAERAKQKSLHQKLRAPLRGGGGGRYDMLAWAYVRGFKFRRCERSHHVQLIDGKPYEHNMPEAYMIWAKLVQAGALSATDITPTPTDLWGYVRHWIHIKDTDIGKAVLDWLADPAGAIAAPAPKPKKPYQIAAE